MIKFGPSGNDKLFYAEGFKSTLQAGLWLKNKGLNAYEYSFGRGITLSDETAVKIGNEMKNNQISVSVHAPYFINFATQNEDSLKNSYDYIFRSLHKLKLLGGNRLVVHPASCGKLDREEALKLTEERLLILAEMLKQSEFSNMLICLETMGKQAQIGTYKEIIDFCTLSDNFIPTFDFGHINCLMQGALKREEDFEEIIKLCINKLGLEKTRKVHIHFSKIQFGLKGEIRHLTLDDTEYGPEFEPLAKVIVKYNLEPTIICESREIMAQDAVKLKNIYLKIKNN